jgi:segregation and condensation protein A
VNSTTLQKEIAPCIVRTEVFEGPLDLLLFLIKKHEIDIFDIPISFITQKYLEYLETMQELQLDIAVEYLEMAAILAQIKSQMLLPEEPQSEELEEKGPDPREELVRRLLEYKKYKQAALQLAQRFILGKDTFPPSSELLEPGPTFVSDVTVFDLMDIVKNLIEKVRLRGKEGSQLVADRITVAERITQIADILKEKQNITFLSLFSEDCTVFDIVITFLAILEMAKLRMISLQQNEPHGDILITPPVFYQPIKATEESESKCNTDESEIKKQEEPKLEEKEKIESMESIPPSTTETLPPCSETVTSGQESATLSEEINAILSDFLKEK